MFSPYRELPPIIPRAKPRSKWKTMWLHVLIAAHGSWKRRHWRCHPCQTIVKKGWDHWCYSSEHAPWFRNIDYFGPLR